MHSRIKLIWDFRGPDAHAIAQHHKIHLDDYLVIAKTPNAVSGIEQLSEFHAIAFVTVDKENMITLRDVLKPHRGEIG